MLCSNCGKRNAKYYRATSGESLCEKCLLNAIYKQVRKFLTLYNVVKRGDSIVYIVRPDRPVESIASLKVFFKFVKGLSLRLHVLIPRNIPRRLLEDLHNGCEFIEFELLVRPSSWVELIKVLDIIAIDQCRALGLRTALTPLYRDELTLLAMMGLMETSPSIFSEALPVKRGYGIVIARPFYYVFSSDIVALAYLNGMYESAIDYLIVMNDKESIIERHFYPIMWRSRELMYSSRKSVELLQSYVLSNKVTCRLCLARSLKDPCLICERLMSIAHQGLYRTSG